MIQVNLDKIPVVCSCGRQTVLVFIPHLVSPDGEPGWYAPQDLNFQYDHSRGWNCGLERHRMASLGGIAQGDYKRDIMEMSEKKPDDGH